ncbi:MAG: glycosyltransferase family 4 protein [Chloroflexota bacterium]|nr:glycosyltransferase family 4 protein [Chloroflexota bacterium]MDE2909265.1 glycosyltransferase family 4 protein [Chloroflexota bacterium]
MKIGLISGEFPPMPGGVGDFTRSLAEALRKQGHEIHILSRQGSTSETLNISSIRGWGPSSLLAIRAWARQRGLDIVNLQYQTAAYDMSPFIHFTPSAIDPPFVTTFHDLRFPYLFPKAGPLRDWIVMRLARASDGVITTNQEDDLRLARLPNRRLIPIGSSIRRRNCNDGDAQRKRWRASTDDNAVVIGHFGFVNAGKGINNLIEALANLRAAGHNLRLLFIGEQRNTVDTDDDAAYLAALENRINRLGLADSISWTGYLSDPEVASCFHAVDLMALPFTDGASYRRSSLIAAIHCGCAILTTQPTVQVEAFEHGDNLWLVPPLSSEAIERGILRLMSDRDLLQRLRRGARQMSQRFDWDAIARETIAFFRTII